MTPFRKNEEIEQFKKIMQSKNGQKTSTCTSQKKIIANKWMNNCLFPLIISEMKMQMAKKYHKHHKSIQIKGLAMQNTS